MSELSKSITKLSKQKMIPAIVTNVLGPYVSVRLSGTGTRMNKLRYVGPTPSLGQLVIVNYQTGTPFVQTQTLPDPVLPAGKLPTPTSAKAPVPEPIFIANIYTYSWPITFVGIGGVAGGRIPKDRILLRIDAFVINGTSFTFNVEDRHTIGATGVDVMASDLVAGLTGSTELSFAQVLLPEGDWLWIDISAFNASTRAMVCLTLGAQE
jgi:hypothetical protein